MPVIDEIKEVFESSIIYSKPVYLLSGCVAAANRNKEEPAGDTEDCTDSAAAIAEHFRECIYLCDKGELEFWDFAIELTQKRVAWEEHIHYQPFGVLCRCDFVYLFFWEDTYYLVIPEELAAIYREVTENENFPVENARNRELSVYAAALIQMYGAYEIGQFINVWNYHRKDKIAAKEAVDFLAQRAYFHSDYYFIEDFMVHDCLDTDEFDELWSETEDIPYYMPTKSVIRELANRGHDGRKIPGEREMDNFLAEYVKDSRELDDLQGSVAYSCERLGNPAEIRELLKKAGAPLDDENFCAGFERLYNNLREATHIWSLNGFTPYQYREETGNTVPRFKLPAGKGRKKESAGNFSK
jgi:hypothetical protein